MRQEPCPEGHAKEAGQDERQDAGRFDGVPNEPYGLKLRHDRAGDGQRCGCLRIDSMQPNAERDQTSAEPCKAGDEPARECACEGSEGAARSC